MEKSPTTHKRIQIWSDGDTRQLLDLYANCMDEIGPLKKFKMKKNMWAFIASQFADKTPKQCEERYKTVLRRKKIAVENNKASGSKRTDIEFDDELTKICLMDESIEPEVQMSSNMSIKAEKSAKIEKVKKKMKSVQEKLVEILEKKEEAKERRHREKMDMLKKILEAKGE